MLHQSWLNIDIYLQSHSLALKGEWGFKHTHIFKHCNWNKVWDMLLEKLLISVVHHTLVLTSIRTNVTREIIIITCAYSADQCIRPLNGPTRFNELPLETDVYRKKKQNKTKYILKSAYLRIKSNGHFIIKTNDLSFESSSVHFEAGNTERNTERTTETKCFCTAV